MILYEINMLIYALDIPDKMKKDDRICDNHKSGGKSGADPVKTADGHRYVWKMWLFFVLSLYRVVPGHVLVGLQKLLQRRQIRQRFQTKAA